MSLACVLISDISGSTRLYETETNAVALGQISQVLSRLRELVEEAGGQCVKSQGDDVLSFFDHPNPAYHAAHRMIREPWTGDLAVHVGVYFGDILSHEQDIYGGAVNTAARLASLAKPGEILFGDRAFDDLDRRAQDHFLMIGKLQLRGKTAATRVYSATAADLGTQTVVFSKTAPDRGTRTECADVALGDRTWRLDEGETLSIGRADSCDIVLDHPWISRSHGALSLRRGQLEYTDHSSTGSVLQISDGKQFGVHRRTTLLSGHGMIYLGAGAQTDASAAISFTTHDLSIAASAG